MRIAPWTLVAAAALLSACTIQINPPQPSPSTSSSPPAAAVLTGQGVGEHPFGSAVGEVEPELRAALGAPSDVSEGTGCPLDPKWTKTVQWQGLSVVFEADTQRRTDDTALASWQLLTDEAVPNGAELGDGLPTATTFAELTAAHPGTSVRQQLGWYLVKLPEGVTYLGDNQTTPSIVHGGPVQWCE